MNLIHTFVNHRLAANLGMVLMILAGVWAITQLNVRLNPVHPMPWVHTDIFWRGASAEDVEKLVTTPLEQQLKTVPDVKTVRSMTRDTRAQVQVELEPDADVQEAVDRVKQRVAQLRSLPTEIEPPVIYSLRQSDLVAAVLITGAGSIDELLALAREMENDLLTGGMDTIEFMGLPAQEIAIQVETRTLFELGLTFEELGARLSLLSMDAPAGTAGRGQRARQLRSLDQRRASAEFEDLPIMTLDGSLVRLGDIARIERRPLVDHPRLSVGGEPAIALYVRRDSETDALTAARALNGYLDARRATLPEGVQLTLFLEAWQFIRDELSLIVWNGVTGLALVIAALVLFLRLLPAFWVTMGIPVTFMAALLGFYALGGTINIVSLVGFVMALGIVVDDAIVVGEEALTQRTRIRAPFPGRVTEIAVAPGELVSPGTIIAEIYDDSALEIRVQIPNIHIPAVERALAAGKPLPVMADFHDRRAAGELERLVGAVGAGQSGVDGLVRLAAKTAPPDLGRAVSLTVTLPPIGGVVSVPVEAVYGEGRVFLIEDGLLSGIDVERAGTATGNNGAPRLLVRSDALRDGARILTSQLSNAVTGWRVRVAEESEIGGV